jgi:hypothetical protein
LRRWEALSARSGGEIEISALIATNTLVDQTHQGLMASLQLLPSDLRCFDDKKTLPKKLGDLLSGK